MYSEERVRKGAEKLTKHIGAKQQGRLDGFFKAVPKSSPEKAGTSGSKGKAPKRKVCIPHFIYSQFSEETEKCRYP